MGGRLTTLTYPDPEAVHEQVSVSYNSRQMGLPAALSSSLAGTWPALSSTYNERAQLTSLTQAGCGACGDLLTTNLSYDDTTTQRGWLTGEQVGAGSSTLLDLQTRYFPNGDVSSVSQDASGTNSPVFTNTFTYDTMDRLASATSTLYPNETYSFDTLGRMSSRTIGGTPYAYTYGDAAHVDAPTAYQGNSYGYDAAGQQTSGPVGGRSETRSFDPEHRLAQVTTTGNASATIGFVYDGTGKRLLQTVTSRGTTTTTLYIGNLYEEQVDADAGAHATYTSYYYLGSQLVGLRRANQGDARTDGVYRLVGDHLGSVTLLVDDASPPGVAQRAYYTPYGQLAYQYTAHGSLTSRNFTGQRLDADTGLLYYGARYYDAVLAYFISADTLAPEKGTAQSADPYAYVLNSPLAHTDPSGHCSSDDPRCNQRAAQEEQSETAADKAALIALGFVLDETCPICRPFALMDLEAMVTGIRAFMQAAGWSAAEFREHIGLNGKNYRITVEVVNEQGMPQNGGCVANAPGCTLGTTIRFNQEEFQKAMVSDPSHAFLGAEETFVHEFGHAWSGVYAEHHPGTDLADEMYSFTHYQDQAGRRLERDTPVSDYGRGAGAQHLYDRREDWAETVAAFAFH